MLLLSGVTTRRVADSRCETSIIGYYGKRTAGRGIILAALTVGIVRSVVSLSVAYIGCRHWGMCTAVPVATGCTRPRHRYRRDDTLLM